MMDDVCEACVVRLNRMLPPKRGFILECAIAGFFWSECAGSRPFLSFLFCCPPDDAFMLSSVARSCVC